MPFNRVGRSSALCASATLAGCIVGALAGYGCQSTQRREPLPTPSAHRVPRMDVPAEPPEAIRETDDTQVTFEERPLLPAAEPEVRVRVAALRGAGAAPKFTHASGAMTLVKPDGTEQAVRSPVQVQVTAQGVTVTEGAGTAAARPIQIAERRAVELRPRVGANAIISYAGTDWPGPVRVVPLPESASAADIVVAVPLERYLPGVLARELYKGWSPETFRAQAVAARSYAVCEHAHWSRVRHYDLIAGEASQAWIGQVKDARALQAVASTRGMLLAYDSRVVPAYYSSTCGGTPANAVDALTRNPNYGIPPLLAGTDATNAHRDCCKSAPKYRWEQTLPVSRVLSQLRRWSGDQLQTVAKAQGTATPPRATAVAANAPLLMRTEAAPPAGELGEAVDANPNDPKSAAPAFDEIAADAPLQDLSRVTGLQSIQTLAANGAGRPVRVRIVDAHGTVLDMRAEDFRRAVNYVRDGESTPKDRLNSSAFRAEVDGSVVRFKGSGFGHGVGMCQFGAEAMAQRGASAEQILRTYYPGANLRKAY